jgi:hypothetical protein
MYIVLFFAGNMLMRVEEFNNYAEMARFVLENGEVYRCEVVTI